MDNLGPAGEWLRISEHYRQMSDGELLILARQKSELTQIAQEALSGEISHRRLKIEPEEAAPPPPPVAPPRPSVTVDPDNPDSVEEDPYAEERALVTICTVWSVTDALQVQALLDTASIPFFMGPERAPSVDAVTSDFTKGVGVQIMQIGTPWAWQVMQHYTPVNDPDPEPAEKEELREIPVYCPKCHSTEIVLEEMIPPAAKQPLPQLFKWSCDSCGHHWEDDGTLNEE